ncbi:MAG: PDZ domain-containing protein, partial [Nitratireductor sp.]
MRDLPKIVADTPVGKTVDVVVLRKGEETTVQVEIGRLEDGEKQTAANDTTEEPAAEPEKTDKVVGLTLQEITDADRETESIGEDVKGVLITEVAPGTNAADKGIQPGEILVEVGQEPVATPADVVERVDALKKEGRKNALMMVSTKTGDIRFVVVRIDE